MGLGLRASGLGLRVWWRISDDNDTPERRSGDHTSQLVQRCSVYVGI